MIRGITLLLRKDEGVFDHLIHDMMLELPLEKYDYTWTVSNAEIYERNVDDEMPLLWVQLSPQKYTYQELIAALPANDYYTIFVSLFAFSGRIGSVGNYQEFVDSTCEIAIILDDTVYVMIYLKGEMRTIELAQRMQHLCEQPIEFITDENDVSVQWEQFGYCCSKE